MTFNNFFEDVSAETSTIQEGPDSLEIIVAEGIGDWLGIESILKEEEGIATEAISSDGSTVLHIAVGIGQNDIVKKLIPYLNDEQVLKQRDSDGSTSLHIASIVGNKDAACLLVKTNRKLLRIKDDNDEEPLQKAYKNMHLDTIVYLLKAVKENVDTELKPDAVHPGDEIAVDLLVNAISAKQYSLALDLVQNFPEAASKSDNVLMAIAKTFPSGLDHWQTLIYPSHKNIKENLQFVAMGTAMFLFFPLVVALNIIVSDVFQLLCGGRCSKAHVLKYAGIFALSLLAGKHNIRFNIFELKVNCILQIMFFFCACAVPISTFISAILVICLLILIICFSFLLLYSLLWKGANILAFPPIKRMENKKKEWDEAKKLLELVCDEIDKLDYSGTYHPNYTRPILEAASQNAYTVVDEILYRSPEAIHSTDKSGYDIIQLAIINLSEKIYNLIYDIGERKNLYRTYKDSFKNNILHLAGRLAPSNVLHQRTGAALQLQRELRWREEVKKFVFPTYITQENIFKETPDMVFTREHENLVKEGEKWMKATEESCSITAALITTIVFAAAITVPGGSNQENGIPLFKKKIPFIIFAISDAISLFASSTALLVFLSILTARFAEKDFLVSVPRRLFIGLFSLLLSTTTMMVAFSATLFLVFCDEKLWMLAPICGLAFIPIAFFVGLQFPLMVDLFRSTYIRIFGKQRKSITRRFNPDDIRLLFGK
ncbi:putative ankyrin repeat-containing domain, PGG domain, ankyrin repeat-containing domain superfamily [Helianthus anomalus]